MYTIAILNKNGTDKRGRVFAALSPALLKDGRFRINHLRVADIPTSREDRRMMTQAGLEVAYTLPAILIKGVRLTTKKPYCKQHALDTCPVDAKRPNSTFLEWSDWLAFHQLINRVCNRLRVSANIWTTPKETLDQGSRMWIRRGTQPRVRWDVEGHVNQYGRVEEVWNHGDDSQFQPLDR